MNLTGHPFIGRGFAWIVVAGALFAGCTADTSQPEQQGSEPTGVVAAELSASLNTCLSPGATLACTPPSNTSQIYICVPRPGLSSDLRQQLPKSVAQPLIGKSLWRGGPLVLAPGTGGLDCTCAPIKCSSVCTGAPNGAACQTSRCSVGQTCQAGVCNSGAPKCGVAGDACKKLFTCSESSGACDYSANKGSCNDGNSCTQNDACRGDAAGTCGGAALNCDDGNACTDDSCNAAGGCLHANNVAACDDGNFCNGPDTCSAGTCGVHKGNPCNDGVSCTVDACDATARTCSHRADDGACSNGLFCDGAETCNAITGCQGGAAPNCDDGVSCTIDACDNSLAACTHAADSTRCDNHVFCDGTETCDAVRDCQRGTAPNCDDGVGCTVDACNNSVAACTHAADNTRCDNHVFCDGAETCDAVRDCQRGTAPNCDDGVGCTVDACNNSVAACTHAADNTRCDNHLFCDGAETCDAVKDCQRGTAPDCDDRLACTVDSCDDTVAHACAHRADDTRCSDALFCNGIETCDATLGCMKGAAPDCRDTIACTQDVCQEGFSSAVCANTPQDSACGDGVGCTVDRCDVAARGCTNTANDALCSNNSFCDGVETCDPKNDCRPGTPLDCDDGVACTTDRCSEGTNSAQCVHSADNSICDDHNPCTADTCGANASCGNVNVADGTVCDTAAYPEACYLRPGDTASRCLGLLDAIDDSYAAFGNTDLSVPAGSGLFGNDIDDEPSTLGSAWSLIASDSTSLLGGTVHVAADGGFTYDPPAGATATTDSFHYTVGKSDGRQDTATVTITLEQMVWYVDNQNGTSAGDGRRTHPFDTLLKASNAAQSGQTVYVYRGTGTATGYAGGFTMKQGQRLIGQGEDLVLLHNGVPQTLVSAAIAPPVLGTGGQGIVLAADAQVRSLDLDHTLGDAIAGTSIGGTVTLAHLHISSAGGDGVFVRTGADVGLDVSDVHVASAAGHGVFVRADGGNVTLDVADSSVTGSGFDGINAGAESLPTAGHLVFNLTHTTVDGATFSDNAVRLWADDAASLDCTIEGNTLSNTVGPLLALNVGGAGSQTRCTIGGAGSAANTIQNSTTGAGIDILADGDAPTDAFSAAILLDNNAVHGFSTQGIRVRMRDSTAANVDVHLANNSVSAPNPGATDGVLIKAEDGGDLCIAFSNNTSVGGSGASYALVQAPSALFNVEGGAGAVTGGSIAPTGTIGNVAAGTCTNP